ncbi:MAG TPA: class I SAM-dependent rRNA methyltransferase [Rhodocyclaceae bacterium]|jgi:23S rRNA (cytosine1962-C5)-methyltransferase
MAQLILEKGKEHSVLRHHPWVFSASVKDIEGRARAGDTVEVMDHRGRILGKAAWSPESRIRARMWTFDPAETIDDVFFKRHIAAAVARRQGLPSLKGADGKPRGLRLIHAESDGLPGLVADQYGDTVVVQLTSTGTDKWRKAIVAALVKATGCARVFERSDVDSRKQEGLEPVTGWLHGEAPAADILVEENGVTMKVDIEGGHKTGFYLDQRDNRQLLGQLSAGKRVLNCFCYTGGFSLQALAGGATEVISVDSSQPALDTAAANLALNPELDASRAKWVCANVFDELRRLKDLGEQFDIIVLDPPKFAPTARHAETASRAYKDIALNGFKLLAPGGLMMSYSCSGGISLELFQQITAAAALDAGRSARIMQRLQGAADHPVALSFPEGEYLKGLLVQAE